MTIKNKELNFDIKQVSDEGHIEGYLNTFNFIDHVLDNTQPAAFKNSLKEIQESGRKLPMLYQHDQKQVLGVWEEIYEDDHGLYGKGKINTETTLGKEVLALVKQGAITGISIGYSVIKEKWDSLSKCNLLQELKLRETSLVTMPCNDQSRIEVVKTLLDHDELPSRRDIEKLFKDSGMTNKQAKTVAAKYMQEPEVIETEINLGEIVEAHYEKLTGLMETKAAEQQVIADEAAKASQKEIQDIRAKYSRYLK
ncbi:MAG: HK97 family phage prohead protease [Robiginitomaculum sp.]|nr:MAG: HK97 family phage prohead protease [Robiginitomaculum sp.]